MIPYDDFLRAKVKLERPQGVMAPPEPHPNLKPHQNAMVEWLVTGGRRALFASFGLGKTVVQLDAVNCILRQVGGRGLIVCPLGVRQEFVRDARQVLKWDASNLVPRFIRSIEEADTDGIYLTNYETVRDGKLDPRHFTVASLDEASILRGFGGSKTFREFMRLFTGDAGPKLSGADRRGAEVVPYRFVATATPSPNEYIELLAYADFLGVMDVSQAKTRFFKRDSTKADKLTLHPHKEEEFWLWVSSWALFVQRPSDLGFSDKGYALPPLDVRWHEVETDHHGAGVEKSGQHKMFKDAALGVQDASREKRESLSIRVSKVIELLCDEAGKKRPLQGLVSTESGNDSRETEGSQSAELPGEPRKVQGAHRCLAKEKPSPHDSTSTRVRGEERAEASRLSTELLPEQQGAVSITSPDVEAQASIQSHALAVRGAVGATGRSVRDLREADDGKPSSGSLPQNGEGPGPALHAVQFGAGDVLGQSSDSDAGDTVPQQFVVWCDLNDEQVALEKSLEGAGLSFSSLTGSDSLENREALLEEWRAKKTAVFLSKPTMYGAGINLQQCHTMVFAGIGFKFCDLIQALHRIYRFLQTRPCTVHLIYTEAEREVRKQLERKWTQHEKMVDKMTDIIRRFGLNHQAKVAALTRNMGTERAEASGKRYTLVNWDSVLETQRMEEKSVGLILTSIPFSTQYEYSPNYADFGHSQDNEEFFRQMDYLTPGLFRVLQPGRVAAIHVKDRIVPGGLTGLGFQTVYPFHARCIEHYTKHGFAYLGMKTIVTDVVRENNQTYRLGWTEQCKDGSRMGVGMPEYLLLFRRPPTDPSRGYADVPVVKDKEKYTRARWQLDAHGFTRSAGERLLSREELLSLPHDAIYKLYRQHSLEKVYSFEEHVRIGENLEREQKLPTDFMLLPPQSWSDEVWTDITRMLTLNGAQSAAGKEMHLCPMQFDIADRVIEQMSNPGETVFDPFAGLGTVPLRAMLKKRRGYGCELSRPYWTDSVHYCRAAEAELDVPTLFNLDECEVAA